MDLPMINTQHINESIGSRALTMAGMSPTLIEANAKGIYTKSSYGSIDDEQATYQGKNWIKGVYHDGHEPNLDRGKCQGYLYQE
jgi:hypothetical protein